MNNEKKSSGEILGPEDFIRKAANNASTEEWGIGAAATPPVQPEKKSDKKFIIIAVAVLALLLLAFAIVFGFSKCGKDTEEEETTTSATEISDEEDDDDFSIEADIIEVPELKGKSIAQAKKLLNKKNISYEIFEEYSESVPKDEVISQSIDAGTRVTEDTLIYLTVSLGEKVQNQQQGKTDVIEKVIEISYVTMSPSAPVLEIGEDVKISVTIFPAKATEKNYMLISNNNLVASVGEKNTVCAVAPGKATVTAYTPDGRSLGSITVTVKEPGTQPKVTQPKTTQPKVTAPAPTQPKPTAAPVTQPKTTKPQIVKFKVTFDVNGGNVAEASRNIEKDAPYGQLPVPTRNGYTFDGWYTEGGVKVTPTTELAYNRDHTLTARWTPNDFTDWSFSEPPANVSDSQIETRTVYSYRTKETTTSGNSSLGDGWILSETTSTRGDYGSWSSWSKTKPAEQSYRQTETKTVTDKAAYTEYTYGRWVHSCSCSGKYTALQYCTKGHSGTFKTLKTTSALKCIANYGSWAEYKTSDGQLWFRVTNIDGSNYGGDKKIAAVTHTEYRYRDRQEVFTYHYYRWSDWSGWSTTKVESTSDREVRTDIQYRYRPN